MTTPLPEYWDMLNRHDWFYMYSDDGGVYRRGSAAEDTLIRISKESPAHKKLYDAFRDHMFGGKDFGVENRPPKPARPEEVS